MRAARLTSRPAYPRRRKAEPTSTRRVAHGGGGYRQTMLQLARSPRWIGGLLLAIAAAAVCTALGEWQWGRSQGPNSQPQNLVYALNWWLFAGMCLWFWGKALRDEAKRLADPNAPAAGTAGLPTPAPTAAAAPVGDAEVDEWNTWLAELDSRRPR